jgi:RimJ/RimL family protein N-acetyltransferase
MQSAHAVPAIETERLILRAHRLDDLDASAAMWADPVVTQYITGRASTQQETWFRLLRYAGHWALLGYGYWAIEEKSSRAFIGELGFADYRRGIPEIDGAPELGWALASPYHGKGYATEAVQAVVGWGDVHFDAARTVCIITPENVASVRVAEKCGFKRFADTTFNGVATMMFERVNAR